MTAETLPLRLGVRLPPCARIDQVAEAAALAERLGFDSVWMPDSQLIWRDTWMALALAAVSTRRITLGTAVTNVVTRHPSVIASAMRTLQELAPGRCALGLGIGWSSSGMVGLPKSNHEAFFQAISNIETLLSGGKATFNGVAAELTGAAGACPVYVGAQGARNLYRAGATARGVIITMALAPGLLERKLDHVRSGAQAAGRDMSDLDIVVWAPAHLSRDGADDLRPLKPMVYIALRNQPADELEAAGITTCMSGPVPAGIEPDGTHVADWELARAACDALVSDALARQWVDAFAVVGTAASIRTRLGEIAARGVNTLVLTPLVGDSNQSLPIPLLESFASGL